MSPEEEYTPWIEYFNVDLVQLNDEYYGYFHNEWGNDLTNDGGHIEKIRRTKRSLRIS